MMSEVCAAANAIKSGRGAGGQSLSKASVGH